MDINSEALTAHFLYDIYVCLRESFEFISCSK